MNATTQAILDWSRTYIADPKTRNESLREFEIGRTTVATDQRETFYLKHPAVSSVTLYIDPYFYSSTATLKTAAATDMVFMYNATLQQCIIPSTSDTSIRPTQHKPVLANYEYSRSLPYVYSDTELVGMLPQASTYLNNRYLFSYSYTGTIDNFTLSAISISDQDILSRSLAIVVRKSYVSEQMKNGLGVAFKGPMAAIDSKTQLNAYLKETSQLEQSIADEVENDKLASVGAGGAVIDLYDETVVDA